MGAAIVILGEALMDCIAQPDGTLLPVMGGSPFNLARAAALQGADVGVLAPFSLDAFGRQLKARALADGVRALSPDSRRPTSLAVVTLDAGQPSYGFYREGIADRDYRPQALLGLLRGRPPGVLHTGSLMLVPPDHDRVLEVVAGARALGWTISVDVNWRPAVADDVARYREAVQQALALADWVKASDEDLLGLGFGAAGFAQAEALCEKLAHAGHRRIALTFGDTGAMLRIDGQAAVATPPRVDVVDTVGAGDTFWGSCLADWAEHPDGAARRVQATLQRAMMAAAINCARKGCQPPTRAELALPHLAGA
jgi:fructokinase